MMRRRLADRLSQPGTSFTRLSRSGRVALTMLAVVVLLAVFAPLVLWQWSPAVRDVKKYLEDPAAKADYFQPLRDFAPVALLSRFPMLLAAGAATPYRTVADLVAAARAAPRSIGFGTSDAAISYAGNLFTRLAGIEMVEVSYRGAAPMLNDLIAGHLPVGWTSTASPGWSTVATCSCRTCVQVPWTSSASPTSACARRSFRILRS